MQADGLLKTFRYFRICNNNIITEQIHIDSNQDH